MAFSAKNCASVLTHQKQRFSVLSLVVQTAETGAMIGLDTYANRLESGETGLLHVNRDLRLSLTDLTPDLLAEVGPLQHPLRLARLIGVLANCASRCIKTAPIASGHSPPWRFRNRSRQYPLRA